MLISSVRFRVRLELTVVYRWHMESVLSEIKLIDDIFNTYIDIATSLSCRVWKRIEIRKYS